MYGGKPAVAGHLRPDVRRFGEWEGGAVRQRDTCIVGLAVVIVSTADALEFVGWLERIAALEDLLWRCRDKG